MKYFSIFFTFQVSSRRRSFEKNRSELGGTTFLGSSLLLDQQSYSLIHENTFFFRKPGTDHPFYFSFLLYFCGTSRYRCDWWHCITFLFFVASHGHFFYKHSCCDIEYHGEHIRVMLFHGLSIDRFSRTSWLWHRSLFIILICNNSI